MPQIHAPLFYAVAIPAVVLMGLSKGGFAGVGAVSMPLLALVISPVQAAAILLPILIVQDAVSVWAFRRSWNGRILAIGIPSALVGIVLGYLFAAKVSTAAVLALVGVISVVFALWRLWLDRKGKAGAASPAHSPAADTVIGIGLCAASGFTSQIAHAGQPPFQMWILPKRLEAATFIGTSAIYFAAVNWLKAPAYMALGQFTPENLATSAVLVPVAIASTFAGVWLVRRVDASRFYVLIYALMILVGGQLIWEALRH